MSFIMQEVTGHIEKNKQRYLEQLVDLLRIPSVSAKADHREHLVAAADWLEKKFRAIGLEARQFDQDKRPVVYAEWMKAGNAPTVLFYGHYDVQPPEPLELWKSPPFEPRIEGQNLYARGASDDKGQLFTHLAAVESFLETKGKLPLNVKFIIEGEEEIGSPAFEDFVKEQADLLKADCVVVSDSPMWAEGVPSLCYGLRGMMTTEIFVRGPNRDLHSGLYGGAVANPINVLCQMVGKLHDEDGRVAVPGFYDEVLPLEEWEQEEFSKLHFDEEEYKKDLGLNALQGELGYSTLERLWARPTLDLNGIKGGYQGDGSKTVIASEASAKISLRLVPKQNPDRIFQLLRDYLKSICPPSVELEVRQLAGGAAVLMPTKGGLVESAKEAFEHGFGKEPVMTRMGASIPIVNVFSTSLRLPCLLMSFGLPDDNLHSPNEKFSLKNFYGGMKTIAYFINKLAAYGPQVR
jgi:acetylornithine deacetylase/succinyl-diaminopimelate desuccinylase-like protein